MSNFNKPSYAMRVEFTFSRKPTVRQWNKYSRAIIKSIKKDLTNGLTVEGKCVVHVTAKGEIL